MKLKEPEWLFKQSEMGGPQHIIVNVEDYLSYMETGNFQAELRIDTLCWKNLKYNPRWSVVKKAQVVRNLCPACLEEVSVRAIPKKQQQADLPF